MEQFFLSDYNEPAIVQEKKKTLNFTLTEIGGPKEIIEWRKQQEMKFAAYSINLQEKDGRLADFEESLGQRLDRGTAVRPETWEERQAGAIQELKRLQKPESSKKFVFEPEIEPKKSIIQIFKKWIVGVWNSANS